MAAAFVHAVDGTEVELGPLQEFTAKNSFADFSSSSFPVFAMDSKVSKSDLQLVADAANKQARTDLGFEEDELAEMGYPAIVPDEWQFHDKSPRDVARWYHGQFDKNGSRDSADPQWYPIGFLGVASDDWKESGVVLVFYDARHSHPQEEPVPVKAFVLNPEKIGPALISFRQGDDDYENVKKEAAKQ